MYNSYWTQIDFRSSQKLWRAVILQAYTDFIGADEEYRQEVREWLGSGDFLHICDMAEMCPRNTKEKFNGK